MPCGHRLDSAQVVSRHTGGAECAAETAQWHGGSQWGPCREHRVCHGPGERSHSCLQWAILSCQLLLAICPRQERCGHRAGVLAVHVSMGQSAVPHCHLQALLLSTEVLLQESIPAEFSARDDGLDKFDPRVCFSDCLGLLLRHCMPGCMALQAALLVTRAHADTSAWRPVGHPVLALPAFRRRAYPTDPAASPGDHHGAAAGAALPFVRRPCWARVWWDREGND